MQLTVEKDKYVNVIVIVLKMYIVGKLIRKIIHPT